MPTRRQMLLSGAAVAGAALAASGQRTAYGATDANDTNEGRLRAYESWWEKTYSGGSPDVEPLPPGRPGDDYKPVITPNGATLPFRIVDGVKVFHLIVEETEHEFAPGLKATCWAYNGQVTALTIEAVQGERVRIYVTNRLPAATSVHWHGVYLPNGMDGVGGLTGPSIGPGQTVRYEWTLRQHGTFMFHSHHDEMTQLGVGLSGMFVIHPRQRDPERRVDRDFSIMIGEFTVEVGTSRPNPIEDRSFNVLTFNGKAFPGTAPLLAKTTDRVRIRFGNLSAMDHHPIHLHGHRFRLTATDGEEIPLSAQWPETTVLVAVGQTREIELVTDAPGDWAMHCHMTHHVMNQMGHKFPNMLGIDERGLDEKLQPLVPDYMTMGATGMGEHMPMGMPRNSIAMKGADGPFGFISMGGLMTVVKVRDHFESYDRDPGWYAHPKGTVVAVATGSELRRDGIKV